MFNCWCCMAYCLYQQQNEYCMLSSSLRGWTTFIKSCILEPIEGSGSRGSLSSVSVSLSLSLLSASSSSSSVLSSVSSALSALLSVLSALLSTLLSALLSVLSALLSALCQGHSSLDAPSELNPPQRIPSPLSIALLVPQAEG